MTNHLIFIFYLLIFIISTIGFGYLFSTFFHVDDVKFKITYEDKSFKIYAPINNMCWAAPTPWTQSESLKVKRWHGFKIIQNVEK